MYVVTGATGQVGSAVARSLLAQGLPVRVVVRDEAKGEPWAKKGCEVAVADYANPEALTKAFQGADGVFVLMPPNYDPAPGFPQTIAQNDVVYQALAAAKPAKVVALSTVGAHVARDNLLVNLRMSEERFSALSCPIAFLRAAWFMENSSWDLAGAKQGQINCFLQPGEHPIPMIAVKDIGGAAAKLLQQSWTGKRIIELEASERYNAVQIAQALTDAFGHPVKNNYIPRSEWESLFRSQGASNPMPRIRMLDGFNEGWIDFERTGTEQWKGETSLTVAIAALVAERG